MPIEIIDKLKQKNNGSFKLIDAVDVETANGESLEEKLNSLTNEQELIIKEQWDLSKRISEKYDNIEVTENENNISIEFYSDSILKKDIKLPNNKIEAEDLLTPEQRGLLSEIPSKFDDVKAVTNENNVTLDFYRGTELKKSINFTVGQGVGGGGSLTEEQEILVEQIPNKFDDVEVSTQGEETVLTFYSNGELKKEIRFSTVELKRGTISTSFIDGTIVSQKDMVVLPYVFETENIGNATLFVNITCGLKSKELQFEVKKIGAGNANIGILDKGINNISMYIVDASNQMTNMITFDVICGALEITSTFDDNQDFQNYSSITIPVIVDALSEDGMTMIVNIDGSEFTQDAVNGFNQFNFPTQFKTVGVHSVSIMVDGGKYKSNILTYNVIIASSEMILLSSKKTELIYEESVKFDVDYRVSMIGTSIFNAVYYIDNNKKLEQQIKLGDNQYSIDYNDFPVGPHTLRIVVSTLDGTLTSEITFNITIIENSFKRIKFAEVGLEALFQMNKKSNSDNDKEVLESSVLNSKGQRYKLTLHDYNYNTNGWIKGRLVSNGSAWAEIDMKPFEDNCLNGFTFDMSFKASNMGDDDNIILTCIGSEIANGIEIDSSKAILKTESNELSNFYTNDKDTRVTFVVHRTSTYLDKWLTDDLGNLVPNPDPVRLPNPMIQCYIDGILTEIAMLSDSGTGGNKIYESIVNNEQILINTDKLKEKFGVSEIKTIAIYNRPLEHEEVLQNLMADIDDLTEQKAKYDKNYVTINQDIPTLYINDSNIGKWADTTKDNKQYLSVTYSSPNPEKFGPSFESISQTAWQGTSSLAYPIKNIKLKLYDYQVDEQGNPINTTDTKSFVKKKVDLFGARDGDGYEEQVFTIKVDYMDSSHCRNTGTARMTNDFLFAGNPNPAKQIDPKTRDAINGVPVQIYINGEWIGLGNFNHDKSCFKSLGMETVPNTVRWEIKANTDTSEGAFNKTWEEGNVNDIYTKILKDFEIVYDEDAFEENSGEFDVTKYYDELNIPHTGTVIGGYKDYAILSLARYIQFVSETTDKEEFKQKAPQYFNVDRACRYYLNVMLMGMIDNFAKNCIINMYGDDIWWYSFYDLDSQLGLDNTGYQKFKEDIEPSHPNVYNCSTSKMWVKLNEFFKEELFNNFNTLRNTTYTYENICKYLIDLQINELPEIAYNRDMYAKYVSQGRRYLHMLHGNNKAHILRWLYNRFLYIDSLFLQQNSPYTKQSITIRSCKPLSGPALENIPDGVQYRPKFEIETYSPQYVTIAWRKNTYVTKRVGWGEKVVFEYDMTNSQDNEIIVYCAGNLKRIGDCTDKNPTSIDIGSAFKLIEFKCENSDVLVKADLSKNTYLKTVSFRNCINLGNTTGGANVLDVSKCTNLRTIDIRNTSITAVLTNADGGNVEEIYYPIGIQNIVVRNQTNLRNLSIPYECRNLTTVEIGNCNNLTSISTNGTIDFNVFKYVQNLSIENSLDLAAIKFQGLSKLKSLTLKNMLNLNSCGFDDMLSTTDTPTLKTVQINNCPNIETLTMNVSNGNNVVAFDNAVLDLRYATSIKKISSNTALVGLTSLYLPNSIKELEFKQDYHKELSSDLINLWGSNNIQDNLTSGYSGLDFAGLAVSNIDLTSLKKLTNSKNSNIAPITYFKSNGIILFDSIDLTNYTGSYVGLFKNVDLRNTRLICSKDIDATDFTSMFEGALISETTNVSDVMARIKKATNCTRMFANSNISTLYSPYSFGSNVNLTEMYSGCEITNIDITLPNSMLNIKGMFDINGMFAECTNLTHDIKIPSNVTNCSEMFKNCTSMTHIRSNWENEYNSDIISTDCYSGCTAITHIDGESVIAYEGDSGLDSIPPNWGGYGHTKEYTGVYRVEILSPNYTFSFASDGLLDNGYINWGDGTITQNEYSHTYVNAGVYTIKGKVHSTYETATDSMKLCLKEILQYPIYGNLSNAFIGCTALISANISGNKYFHITRGRTGIFQNCTNLERVIALDTKLEKEVSHISAFQNCNKLREIIGLEDFIYNTQNLMHCFNSCSSLPNFTLSEDGLKNCTSLYSAFYSCTSLTESPIKTFNVPNISKIFEGCTNITDISGVTFGEKITLADRWQPPNLITANNIKINCASLSGTHSTTNKLFRDCKTLKYANNVVLGSNITNIMHLFNGCSALESVSLSGGGELTDISCLFFLCEKLSSVDISGLNLSNVKYAGMAFQVCSSLKVLENITLGGLCYSSTTDTYHAGDFIKYSGVEVIRNCTFTTPAIKELFCTDQVPLRVVENITIDESITDLSGMFENCIHLEQDIVIPSHITNCSEMFKNCTSMTHIHSNWENEYSGNIVSTDCYSGCTAITHIDDNNIIAYEGDNGLNYIPTEWGGNGVYQYYYNEEGSFERTFAGEIERIPENEASSYLNALSVMTEAEKTSFVNALKDYSGQETAILYGASQYLSTEQIAIASAKNWTVT